MFPDDKMLKLLSHKFINPIAGQRAINVVACKFEKEKEREKETRRMLGVYRGQKMS